ncbi:MAG: hemerythrin domain-containing protein [Thermoproteota archaeon]|nr:hemerythrin domain-containing protein [Thermoproteota archaeon]
MSATESLRRDHALIEKMLNALKTISLLLKNGKQIPDSILNQAIDFSINFTNTCHHGKEEESLFPTLEKKGMPREGGPIARMLYEHEITKELANSIVNSTKIYISSGEQTELVKNIEDYIQHVSLHLSKENQRLFVMADMLLNEQETLVNDNLARLEKEKFDKIGNSREYYEKLIDNIKLNE